MPGPKTQSVEDLHTASVSLAAMAGAAFDTARPVPAMRFSRLPGALAADSHWPYAARCGLDAAACQAAAGCPLWKAPRYESGLPC